MPEGGIRPAGGQNLGPGNGVLETQARGAAPGRTDGALERAGRQTPYAAQTIGEDGPPTTGGAGLARAAEEFSWLRDRGVRVSREEQPA